MLVRTVETPMPSWQEIGRLAEVIGLPNNKYRSPQSDSVLDKSAAIQLFQRYFRGLLVDAEQISLSVNPAELLTQKLLTTFSDLLPQFPQQIGRLADGLSVVRFVSHPSNRLNSTVTQDLERLSLSSIAKVIEEIATDSASRGSQIYKLQKENFESEGARALLVNSLRLSALRGLSETLIHSGDIGLEFAPSLLSQFNNEPYHALSALYSIGQINVSKNADDLSYFKVGFINTGKKELAEMLNERFQQLKPQVLTLLDQVLTKIASDALKNEISNSTDNQLALRLQLLNFDAIKFLDFADSQILPITLGPTRERVVSAISERVLGDMLRLTLSAWGVSAPKREDGRAVDFIDAILEMRQQLIAFAKTNDTI